MIRSIYKALLHAPRFTGRGRLEQALRGMLKPSADKVDEFRMELDPQEWLQIHLLAGERLEKQTTDLFRELLQPGDTYIDVGSHVGFHVLVAAISVGPRGRVIAIDPQPYNCEKVLANSEINGLSNVMVITAAAGEKDDFVVLRNQKRNDKARLTLAGNGLGDLATRFEVPIRRLDTIVTRHGVERIRLLKVDVEGYEREVFAGAPETLDRTDNVVFESLPETDGAIFQEIVETLVRKSFVLRQIDGSLWKPGCTPIESNIWASKG